MKIYNYAARFGKFYRYLNYRKRDGLFFLSTQDGDSEYQTQFTEKEMAEILAELDDEETTRLVNGLKKLEVQDK